MTLPPSSSLERQLPLFLTDDSEFYWFVLTSESGERWRCFALTERLAGVHSGLVVQTTASFDSARIAPFLLGATPDKLESLTKLRVESDGAQVELIREIRLRRHDVVHAGNRYSQCAAYLR